MRIALLTNNAMPPREGIARHVLDHAVRLKARGHEPIILARGSTMRRWRQSECQGVPLLEYPYPPIKPFHHRALQSLLGAWLERSGGGIDLLHLHLPLLPPLGRRPPSVVTVHSPMLTDNEAISEGGLRPALMRAHARLFSQRYERAVISAARRLLAVSPAVARELEQNYDLHGRCPEVLTNGVDTRFFNFQGGRAARALEPGRPRRLLFAGRLHYRKGLFKLLRAMALLPEDTVLDIAGEGPLRPWLESHARQLRIAHRLQFTGFLDHAGLRRLYHRADLFINPADYESGPLTLLEAMACGTPVVSTATGIVELLGDEPPLIVGDNEPEALVAAIAKALSDPVAADARAQRARTIVESRFDIEALTDRLVDLYEATRGRPA